MNLYSTFNYANSFLPQSFYVVCTISSSCEIGQVELNLVPALVQPHWHCTYEWFHSCSTLNCIMLYLSYLIVGCSEPSSNILIIHDLNLKCEILLELNKHIQTQVQTNWHEGAASSNRGCPVAMQVRPCVESWLLHFWWSWPKTVAWCRASFSSRSGTRCMWSTRWFPLSRAPSFGCLRRWFFWCAHSSRFCYSIFAGVWTYIHSQFERSSAGPARRRDAKVIYSMLVNLPDWIEDG